MEVRLLIAYSAFLYKNGLELPKHYAIVYKQQVKE